MQLSCAWIVALFVILTLLLIRAYYEDLRTKERAEREMASCQTCRELDGLNLTRKEGFHRAVTRTIEGELSHGQLSKSKVQHILTSVRDQVIRGALMGAVGGSMADLVSNAVTWSLVGGVVSGCSDILQWPTK